VHHEVDAAPFGLDGLERCIHRGVVADVAGHDDRAADRIGQRAYALAQRIALIGESQFCALGGAGGGDAPGQRPVIRNAHDQPAPALHQGAAHWLRPWIVQHRILAAVFGFDGGVRWCHGPSALGKTRIRNADNRRPPASWHTGPRLL